MVCRVIRIKLTIKFLKTLVRLSPLNLIILDKDQSHPLNHFNGVITYEPVGRTCSFIPVHIRCYGRQPR
jgi:hypothetical protein